MGASENRFYKNEAGLVKKKYKICETVKEKSHILRALDI